VVLINGSTGVQFLAHPRFAPTFSFRPIGLTDALIYIKPRRLDFLSYSSPPCHSRTVVLPCRRLSSAPLPRHSPPALPPLLCTAAVPFSSHATTAPLSRRTRAACGRAAARSHTAATTPQLAPPHLSSARTTTALRRCRRPSTGSSHRSINRVMGRDKRKGKEHVVEPPKKKKTRSQKEAERAAMAARAVDDQATGHERRL
jgi:hypothetical protein